MTEVNSATGEWRRGWPIAAGSAVMISTGPGLYQNLSSLFTPWLQRDFGWTRGDISTAAGLGLLAALAAPFVGRLLDRIGAVPVLLVSAVLVVLAHLCFASMSGGLWQFQLGVVLLSLSAPGISALLFGKLIARRFARGRGMALGVATAGLSVSTLLLPPVVAWMIDAEGWRVGHLFLAALVVAIGLPAALTAIRFTAVDAATGAIAIAAPVHTGLTAAEARRIGSFWRLALAIALVSMATVGFVTQLVPFGLDHGLDTRGAALLVSSYALSQFVGRLGMGVLLDRYSARYVGALLSLISACGFVALLISGSGFAALMAAVFFCGLMNGADHDLMPYLASRMFGLRNYGEIFGMLFMGSLLGTAAGIASFGRLHDAAANYDMAIGGAALVMVVAAGLIASLRIPDLEPGAAASG